MVSFADMSVSGHAIGYHVHQRWSCLAEGALVRFRWTTQQGTSSAWLCCLGTTSQSFLASRKVAAVAVGPCLSPGSYWSQGLDWILFRNVNTAEISHACCSSSGTQHRRVHAEVREVWFIFNVTSWIQEPWWSFQQKWISSWALRPPAHRFLRHRHLLGQQPWTVPRCSSLIGQPGCRLLPLFFILFPFFNV